MDYPRDFPEHLKRKVDAAMHAAEIQFIDAKKDFSEERFEVAADRLILRYAETVFFGFATQAVEAGREGVWDGERIRQALDDFLKHIGHRAYFDKHPNPRGSERFTETLSKASKNWVGWRAIHEGLKQVAEVQATKLQSPTVKISSAPVPSETTTSRAIRTFREPHPELLQNQEYVNRKKAAEALGTTTRTIDRWTAEGKLTAHGVGIRKAFRSKELLRLLRQKKDGQERQE
jgi:hypothetical protein